MNDDMRPGEAEQHDLDPAIAQLVDYEEAARRLRLSKRAVQQLVADRRVAYIRLGRRVWFRPGDLDAFIERARMPEL